MDLSKMRCVPCEGGVPPMGRKEAEEHLKRLDGWSIKGKLITKEFRFKDFVETMKFVNKVADLAEAEGHHPDMLVSYGKVAIELWTHAVGGLSKNDFVLAAKIDRIKV